MCIRDRAYNYDEDVHDFLHKEKMIKAASVQKLGAAAGSGAKSGATATQRSGGVGAKSGATPTNVTKPQIKKTSDMGVIRSGSLKSPEEEKVNALKKFQRGKIQSNGLIQFFDSGTHLCFRCN
eukprot:TRINITY_DN11819_c0_g2_i2.p1 TRINITY_DN11819_c0_g2~~TRINITY_DN11819_c0_g2_i2.p1  ORF type:complete len:143 (+),score=26.93 TRINITY_DN11819_c0_g2_i2:61-429(+)